MLKTAHEHCPGISMAFLQGLLGVMTNKLNTETLLFATLLVMINRYRMGYREKAPGFRRGAGIMLSAVKKGGTGKMQTPNMKLIHDVFVELPMAGNNFRKLQALLGQNGLTLALMHSCGGAIIPAKEIDDFYEETGEAQEMRTLLDWQGSMTIESPEKVMMECNYSQAENTVVEWIVALTEMMIEAEDADRLEAEDTDETETEEVPAEQELVLA